MLGSKTYSIGAKFHHSVMMAVTQRTSRLILILIHQFYVSKANSNLSIKLAINSTAQTRLRQKRKVLEFKTLNLDLVLV